MVMMMIKAMRWAYVLVMLSILATTACAKIDYTLEVFGNANMDETIDQKDIAFIQDIINGTERSTLLADANNDGKIDKTDIDWMKKIMEGKESEIIIKDALNRTVTVKMPVERVIPLPLVTTESIVAMDADDKVVGVTASVVNQKSLFPRLSQLPNLGKDTLDSVDIEKIISLKPDLVIVYDFDSLDLIKQLEGKGITVVATESHGDLINSMSAARRVGYILGVKDKAEEFTGWYGSILDNISSKVEGLSEDDKPSVVYCWLKKDDENGPVRSSGQDCGVNALIRFVGGRAITDKLPGDYIEIDPEWIMEQNPSIMIREVFWKVSGYEVNNSTNCREMLNGFINRTGFSNIDAVKNGKVYAMSVSIFSDNCWLSAIYMSRLIQPDLFQDLNPRAVHQEYLKRFMKLDFDIDTQGQFLYPVPDDW